MVGGAAPTIEPRLTRGPNRPVECSPTFRVVRDSPFRRGVPNPATWERTPKVPTRLGGDVAPALGPGQRSVRRAPSAATGHLDRRSAPTVHDRDLRPLQYDPGRRFADELPASGAWQPGDPVGGRRFVTVTDGRPFALEGAGIPFGVQNV